MTWGDGFGEYRGPIQYDRAYVPGATSSYTNMGFARGTANTSLDFPAGASEMLATLHRDEAVIPLPDGRSVPVTFSSDVIDRLNAFVDSTGASDFSEAGARERASPRPASDGFSSQQSSSMSRPVISQNIVIKTPDLTSFNRSRAQVMQELGDALRTAERQLGPRYSLDDPTKREV
jgi:hypothetical protein